MYDNIFHTKKVVQFCIYRFGTSIQIQIKFLEFWNLNILISI